MTSFITPYRDTQHAYELMRSYFSKPGARLAYDSSQARCVYRMKDKEGRIRKCAVGCLIPKSIYDPAMEGPTILTLFFSEEDYASDLNKLLENVEPDFLSQAQHLHDHNSETAKDFVIGLDELAKQYDLKVVE